MTTLNVSNIQHFSVGDGPGIRTTVFLKGCNLRCPWCHNPETISPLAEELFFEGANKRVLYGKTMTTDEILQEVMEDEPFYIDGGVTVSGGEPMLQSEGVYEFFEKLKQKGVSTLIDTAGDVPWENFERVKNVTDLFYFDFKTWSGKLYSHIIHGDCKRIYDNLCRLISCGSDVHIRIPLIPEFNTSALDCEEISRMLKEAGAINVDLLPFHRMGEAKYMSLGKEYPYAKTQPLTPQAISFISDIYSKYFNVSVEI